MKRFISLLLTVALVLSFAPVSHVHAETATEKELERIEVTTLPTKTLYAQNTGVLNLGGGVITLTYSDGSVETVDMTPDMVSGFDNTVQGEQTLTVTYEDKTATFTVTVGEPATLVGVSVHTDPTKTQYVQNTDTLDVTGGVLVLTYNNGDTATVAMTVDMVTGFDNTILGEKRLVVTYEGMCANFTVTVVAAPVTLTGISVSTNPTKTQYVQNVDALDVTGGVITLTYSDNSTATVDMTASMVSGFNNTTLGEKTLTVTYEGKTATFTITVVEPATLTGISVGKLPRKTQYIQNADALDLYRGVITLTYSDGTTENVAMTEDGVTVTGFDGTTAGEQTLTVTYEEMTATFTVTVSESQSFGESLGYHLSEDGVLTIFGTGAMEDYTQASDAPWNANKADVKTVVIRDGVTSVGAKAFFGFTALIEVSIGANVTTIGSYAFNGCTGLKKITIPANVTEIKDSAFRVCSNLAAVHFDGNAPTVGTFVFEDCAATLTLEYYENATGFGVAPWTTYAKSMMHTGEWAVDQEATCTVEGSRHMVCTTCGETITETIPCHNFEDKICVVCGAGDVLYSGNCGTNAKWKLDALGILTIYGTGSVSSYSNGNAPWYLYRDKIKTIIVEDGITSLPSGIFYGCNAVESITVPFVGYDVRTASNNYQYPLGYIFGTTSYEGGTITVQHYYGSSISSTTSSTYYIPASLKTVTVTGGNILYGAFYNCSNLTEITLSEDVVSINVEAFYNCAALTAILVDENNANYSSDDQGVLFNKNKTTLIKAPGGLTGSYAVPESVTTIGDYAFRNCTNLTEVSIPDSVSRLGKSVFSGCTSLASVTISESITAIPENTFKNCSSLTTVTIPSSIGTIASGAFVGCSGLTAIEIPSSVTSIAGGAFSGCSGLTSITVPFVGGSAGLFGYIFGTSSYEGGISTKQYYGSGTYDYNTYYIPASLTTVTVTGGSIGYGAFSGCSNLTSITIPNSAASIGSNAFYNCSNLTSIIIPDSVTSIGSSAFYGCTALASATISESITVIPEYAFYNCRSLANITIPSDVTSIGTYAFSGCSGLTSVTIPSSVTSIGTNAFSDCRGLTSVTISSGVTSIGTQAFSGCSGLTTITIPDSVANIDGGAFHGCSGLESMTIPFVGRSATATGSTSVFGYIFGGSTYTGGKATTQYYGTGSYDYSSYYIPTSLKSVIVTGGNIRYGAFHNCANLTSITIPDDATTIGSRAFSGCSGLTSLAIPSTVTGIGDYAFYNCSSLASVTIPVGITAIPQYAFYNCSSLASVTIPNGVTSIGTYAFYGCSGLTSVTIANTVTTIGSYAFKNCSGLTTITVPDSVTSIDVDAFSGCNSLESMTIPFVGASVDATTASSQTLFGYIFGGSSYTGGTATKQYCSDAYSYVTYYIPTSLKTVTVTGGNILYGAFSSCSNLTSITIPDDATSIADRVFFDCSSLTGFTIPESVTSIGSSAFSGCSALPGLLLPVSVTSIGNYAFNSCTNLATVLYTGTETQKGSLSIGTNNSKLDSAVWHCEVEEQQLDGATVYSCEDCGLYINPNGTKVPLQLTVTTAPTNVRYTVGQTVSAAGIVLTGTYSDGTQVTLGADDIESITADTSSAGRKTATVTFAGATATFEIIVHSIGSVTVESSQYPQSNHNYTNNLDETKEFTYDGATSLTITFSSQTQVESTHDKIYIYDGSDNLITTYTGNQAANQTLTISGDTFKVRLKTDGSQTYYGYAFSSIVATMGVEHVPVVDAATATCTGAGLTEGSHCEICGDVIVAQQQVERLGHSYAATFTWNDAHTACTAAITCTRNCGFTTSAACTVSNNEPNQPQTVHTATVTYDGTTLTDTLTCDNFRVIFKNSDGSQISSTYYHSGATVTAPANPTKASDNTYAYTFAGWDPAVAPCTANATYTATYTPAYIDYTVVFKNWDGTVISTKTYHYGDTIEVPANPTRAEDDQNTYTFSGWGATVSTCAGNAEYTAVFQPARKDGLQYSIQSNSVTITGYNGSAAALVIPSTIEGKSVTAINGYVFYNCTTLTNICIPDSVQSIGYYAFYGCSNLTTVFYTGTQTEKNYISFESNNSKLTSATWHYEVEAKQINGATVYLCSACDLCFNLDGTKVPLQQLTVTTAPTNVRYTVGQTVSVAGISLTGTYSDGTQVTMGASAVESVTADTSAAGRKTATVTVAGATATFEVIVHAIGDNAVTVDSSLYPQSSHSYGNYLSQTKTFTHPGAVSLTITFNSQTYVESNFDYIYIYDGNGSQIAMYTGNLAANQTLTITGDTFKVKLTSDYSGTGYGYGFSRIVANMPGIQHVPVVDAATATCTGPGLTEGSHCEICGDVIVAQQQVESLGHSYSATYAWNDDHTACTATITCARNCAPAASVACTVSNTGPNQSQTVHMAIATHNGATFTDTLTCDNFQVIFKDSDGTQISSTYYHSGATVTAPANPTKASDNTYTYTFAGWDPAVVPCTANATYTATYTSTYIDYTVVFKNWDGTTISTKTYHWGDAIEVPANPTKAEDDQNTYTFSGWGATVSSCSGNAEYTAVFQSARKDGLQYSIQGDSVTITGYVGNGGALVIPSTIEGKPVTAISSSAFNNCTSLTSVTIPNSVTSIGGGAFAGCSGLQSITIPFVGGSVKTSSSTYQYPFGYIFGTSSYTGSTATSQKYYRGSSYYSSYVTETFYIPSSLRSVTVTGGNILYGAFYNCSGLTSITLPDNISSIGGYAFYSCSGLTSVFIPDSVTSVGSYAFDYCSNLSQVFYGGTQTEKSGISISYDNSELTSATWHYEVEVKQMNGATVYLCGDCDLCYNADGTKVPLQQLTVTTAPTNVRYIVGQTVSTDGIVMTGTYSDGTQVTLGASAVESVSADMATAGRKTATVTVAGATATFEVAVHATGDSTNTTPVTVDSSLYPQSSHNYSNGLNQTKTFTHPGATSLTITFNSQTKVESGYDYICIYDGNGTQIARYTGTQAANQTLTIPGDTFQVTLTSDSSGTYYGYAFSSIVAYVGQIVHVAVVDPATVTCTSDGLTEGSHCEICGDVIIAQQPATAYGHNMQQTAPAVDATCEADGRTEEKTCANNCGHTVGGTVIPALGHNMVIVSVAIEPTCTTAGCTPKMICENHCGRVEESVEIPATGHNMVAMNAGIEPTCTVNGKTPDKSCTNGCGTIEEGTVILALGHQAIEGICTVCQQQAYIIGDLDGDWVVDINDVVYLLLYNVFGEDMYPLNFAPGDIDRNGYIDEEDAQYLLLYTMYGETYYPLTAR